jgi:hypothetical protein
MRGFLRLAIIIIVIIVAVFAVLYLANVPIMEIAGETIGFADMINFLFFQSPPNLPEADISTNPEMSEWASKLNGSDLGETAGVLNSLGNPLRLCVFRDYIYCQNFVTEGNMIYETSETPERTLYIGYEMAMEINRMNEEGNYEGFNKKMVQAIKKGEVRGITIDDIMKIS